MEKREYKIGDSIETRCDTCDVARPQMVSSVNSKNRITRVTCPRCGNKNRFKKNPFGENRIDRDYAGASRPYHPAEKYDKGEIIQHASFGFGEVVNVIDGGKMEVLFGDRLRCLVQGQGV